MSVFKISVFVFLHATQKEFYIRKTQPYRAILISIPPPPANEVIWLPTPFKKKNQIAGTIFWDLSKKKKNARQPGDSLEILHLPITDP